MNTKPLFSKTVLSIAITTTLAVSAQFTPISAQAEILSIGPNAKVLKKSNLPKHGASMLTVSSKFGSAKTVKHSKGKVTKHNPKITQWIYSGFSVYFENSHVIHSVVRR